MSEAPERIVAWRLLSDRRGWGQGVVYVTEDEGWACTYVRADIHEAALRDLAEARAAKEPPARGMLAAALRELDEARAETRRFKDDRFFVVGWNDGFAEGVRQARDCQPSTAADPNESAYERGRFDGVMEYGRAIAALLSAPKPEETRT
jgi:hypothetical protein